MAMAEVQEQASPRVTSAFHSSAYNTSANISLAKESHMAKINVGYLSRRQDSVAGTAVKTHYRKEHQVDLHIF